MPEPSANELLDFYINHPSGPLDSMRRVVDTYIKPLYERINELEQEKNGGPEGLYLKVVPLEGYQVTEDDKEPGVSEMVVLLSEKKATYLCAYLEDITSHRKEGWTHIITGLGRAIKKLNEQHDPYKEEFDAWYNDHIRQKESDGSTYERLKAAYYAGRTKK